MEVNVSQLKLNVSQLKLNVSQVKINISQSKHVQCSVKLAKFWNARSNLLIKPLVKMDHLSIKTDWKFPKKKKK